MLTNFKTSQIQKIENWENLDNHHITKQSHNQNSFNVIVKKSRTLWFFSDWQEQQL